MQALATRTKRRAVSKPRQDITDCAQELLNHLPNVMAFIRCHVRQSRAKGLSVPQLRALVRIERKGNLSDVAHWLGTTLPTASRIVSGLVDKGYLQRVECCVDRRVKKLSLTARGQKVLNDAFDAARLAMEIELRSLPAAEVAGLTNAARTLGTIFTDRRAS